MTAEFREPGSGQWMPVHFSLWYAMSDAGGAYAIEGAPWWSLERALAATRDNVSFLVEYGLKPEDVSVPGWRPETGDWDDMSMCSLLCSVNLHEFWREQEPASLEYR